MTDNNGTERPFASNPEEIEFYLSKFEEFNQILSSLLTKEPDTRTAILEARYKDLILLKEQMLISGSRLWQLVFKHDVLQADRYDRARIAEEQEIIFEEK